jgi:hypothetical protein
MHLQHKPHEKASPFHGNVCIAIKRLKESSVREK